MGGPPGVALRIVARGLSLWARGLRLIGEAVAQLAGMPVVEEAAAVAAPVHPGPPEHWLELVRRGAPGLLSPRDLGEVVAEQAPARREEPTDDVEPSAVEPSAVESSAVEPSAVEASAAERAPVEGAAPEVAPRMQPAARSRDDGAPSDRVRPPVGPRLIATPALDETRAPRVETPAIGHDGAADNRSREPDTTVQARSLAVRGTVAHQPRMVTPASGPAEAAAAIATKPGRAPSSVSPDNLVLSNAPGPPNAIEFARDTRDTRDTRGARHVAPPAEEERSLPSDEQEFERRWPELPRSTAIRPDRNSEEHGGAPHVEEQRRWPRFQDQAATPQDPHALMRAADRARRIADEQRGV